MRDNLISAECTPETTSLCVRQPLFTRDKTVWGYEVKCSCTPPLADGSSAKNLSDHVAAFRDTLAKMLGRLADNYMLVLNIGEENMFCDDSASGEWQNCVFKLDQDALDAPECDAFIDCIRDGGGLIALDECLEPDAYGKVADECDYFIVSIKDVESKDVILLRKKYKDYPGKLIVRDVADWQDYEGARALGFDYFQGSFFTVPEVKKVRELGVNIKAKMELMRELGNPDVEMEELAEIIATDVSLSYRILKYINSAAVAVRNEVKSIPQAVSLLGLKEVRHWAMVVIMTGLDSSEKGAELGFMALHHGRFLNQLAEQTKGISHQPSVMFLLGLFSKLDALLGCPMEEALLDIPMDKDMYDALCGVMNDYRDWLLMLEAIEVGNWDIATMLLAKHKVNFCVAATEFLRSSTWASTVVSVKK